MTPYIVEFYTHDLGGRFEAEISWPLADFKDGFWVNESITPTKGMDCMYYILPHMIKHIRKNEPERIKGN